MSLHAELGIVPNVLHANFSLEREGGEAILLSNPQGELVSGIAYPEQTQDHSYGMHSDSDGEEVQAAMLVDEPPIYVGVGPEPRELWVAPVALQEGEENLVARRLLAALTGQ